MVLGLPAEVLEDSTDVGVHDFSQDGGVIGQDVAEWAG
jgi:hypothetical protein